jgi:PRC-barrel domain
MARRLLLFCTMEHVASTLRYIAAEHVDTPTGRLDGTVLISPSDEPVGTLDGMIIDPIERHVRYYVVRSRNWLKTRLHLVPATPARLDSEHKTLHVDINADDLPQLREIRPDTFERYSDDDLIAALFPAHAA